MTSGSPLPHFDVYAPLPSLPHLLGATLETATANTPYVFADPGLLECWPRELSAIEGFKIGIAWRGSQAYPGDGRSARSRLLPSRLWQLSKAFVSLVSKRDPEARSYPRLGVYSQSRIWRAG